MKGTPYERAALKNVSLEVEDGVFLGIIGATGSGKSTFIKHLNGLIKLTEGNGGIVVDGIDLTAKKPDLKLVRQKIGMVFQYPESQLFAETVLDDVCYGPRNMKKSREECEALAKEAMTLAGLDFENFKGRSPFELSGGEKRRAAIAGVIACRPEYLILDEPSAGLDPKGKDDIYALIGRIRAVDKVTVVVVSHDVDEICEYADRIAAFDKGEIFAEFDAEDIGEYGRVLREKGLGIPLTARVAEELKRRGIEADFKVREKDFTESVLRYYAAKRAVKKEGGGL
jgi:energy-coupling factor transport system ATP-binding protein